MAERCFHGEEGEIYPDDIVAEFGPYIKREKDAAVAACSAQKDKEIAELRSKLSDLEGMDKVYDETQREIGRMQDDTERLVERIRVLEVALRGFIDRCEGRGGDLWTTLVANAKAALAGEGR